jgi:hypothetical protein
MGAVCAFGLGRIWRGNSSLNKPVDSPWLGVNSVPVSKPTKTMKKSIAVSLVAMCLLAATIVGCTALATKSPTAIERLVYDVHTNYVNVYTVQTNYAVATITNILDQVVQVTNQVLAVITNQQAEYGLTVKPGTTTAVTAGGVAANTMYPGIGSMASMGVLALLGAWAWFRGRKSSATSTTLAQEIETMREFILTLSNGTKYDTAITGWLQTHQLQTGVADQVLSVLANQVSNPDAKAALINIQQALAAAQGTFVTTAPVTIAPAPVAPVVLPAGTVIPTP